jgi:hypothetical protein
MAFIINRGKRKGIFYIPSGGTVAPTPVPTFTNTKSLDFDGIDDYVDIGELSVDGETAATWSCWFKPSDTNWHYLYGDDMMYFLYKQSLDRVDLRFNNNVVFRTTELAATLGDWYNVILTFDGSLAQADRLKMYLNGGTPLANSLAGPTGTEIIKHPSRTYKIGRSGNSSSSEWVGNIDEFSIFNVALSQAQVVELYNTGTPTDLTSHSAAAGLVNWWRMGDDATFPTIPDQKESDDGTMTNMVAGDIVADVP